MLNLTLITVIMSQSHQFIQLMFLLDTKTIQISLLFPFLAAI